MANEEKQTLEEGIDDPLALHAAMVDQGTFQIYGGPVRQIAEGVYTDGETVTFGENPTTFITENAPSRVDDSVRTPISYTGSPSVAEPLSLVTTVGIKNTGEIQGPQQ